MGPHWRSRSPFEDGVELGPQAAARDFARLRENKDSLGELHGEGVRGWGEDEVHKVEA